MKGNWQALGAEKTDVWTSLSFAKSKAVTSLDADLIRGCARQSASGIDSATSTHTFSSIRILLLDSLQQQLKATAPPRTRIDSTLLPEDAPRERGLTLREPRASYNFQQNLTPGAPRPQPCLSTEATKPKRILRYGKSRSSLSDSKCVRQLDKVLTCDSCLVSKRQDTDV